MSNEGIDIVVSTLKDSGYSVKKDVRLKGYSGIRHKFDVVAVKGEIKLFFNFINSNKKVTFEYLSMIGKYIDLKSSGAKFFLIANTSGEQDLEPLYSEVSLITYTNSIELVDKIQRTLKQINSP